MLADAPPARGDRQRAGRRRPYATVLVDQLESMNLVERSTDAADRQPKLVSLMPAGEQKVATARDLVEARPPRWPRSAAPSWPSSAIPAKLALPQMPQTSSCRRPHLTIGTKNTELQAIDATLRLATGID